MMSDTAMLSVFFHVDVGREEGWGHLSESLSVAAALKLYHAQIVFILPEENETAHKQVAKSGYLVYSLPSNLWQDVERYAELRTSFSTYEGQFLVANLVYIADEYAQLMDELMAGWAIVTEHSEQELAPINFNISRFPKYMPLRKYYQDAPTRQINDRLEHILISFGGSDPKNVSGFVLEMLRQGFESRALPLDIRFTVIKGPLYEHGEILQAMQDMYPVPLSVVGPVSPEVFADLAMQSDMAITTGGGTMYEFCALGLPSIVIPILDKMDANARVLLEKNAVFLTPRVDRLTAEDLINMVQKLLDHETRVELSQTGQAVMDGKGAHRIADRLVAEWSLI